MMNLKPYSASALALAGLLLAGMGLYFIFLRPPLLPEDMRYMGSAFQNESEKIKIANIKHSIIVDVNDIVDIHLT